MTSGYGEYQSGPESSPRRAEGIPQQPPPWEAGPWERPAPVSPPTSFYQAYQGNPAPVTALPSPPLAARPKRSWPSVFALILALLLAPVAGYEGYLLYQMEQRLDAANKQASADRATDSSRFDGVEKRTEELEKAMGSQFNAAAVAAAALPSVFRVEAGDFTGTAFAIGREPSGGGTYLFTNFHVVEQVWNAGDRGVFLERKDERFPATIIKVDRNDDVALLQAKEKFPRLTNAAQSVKSGEQIVVVGAPLGLEGTVTTGVVSAPRKIPDYASEVLQFDAAINPGNSGGPVINSQKQVVGIASAKARESEGIGLAVQIATACRIMAIC